MNRESFEKEVRAAENTLYRISKTILQKDHDCEDAVQEAILKAYEKLGTLKEDKYFRTWLIRILINECYRIAKGNNKFVGYDDYMEAHEEDAVTEKENYSDLYLALQKLAPKMRVVIVLYYVEEYSVSEIAKMLGIPSGTVKSRLALGRRKLKKILCNIEPKDESSFLLIGERGIRHESF